jgi:3-deoxy-D-manno-octulosonic-acid transferase
LRFEFCDLSFIINGMLRFAYNLVFPFACALAAPYYLWRMWRRGNVSGAFGERLAWYSPELRARLSALRAPVWIHAVSVGEMMLASVLARELRTRRRDLDIVITTTTVTGRQVGQKLADDHLVLLYNPLDWWLPVRRAFGKIKPRLLVLMEQEIWPNYLWQAAGRDVPVWLLNARLSDRSCARFKKYRKFLRSILGKLSLTVAQDEEDAARLADAGFPAHTIFSAGSMKFDVAQLAAVDGDLAGKLRARLGWRAADRVLLAGSTFAGEERIFLELFAALKKQHADLRLVLAPRHVERSGEIEALCREFNVSVARQSDLSGDAPLTVTPDVLLSDLTGVLRSLYELGAVNFVGKSLCGRGGQNFIEAARAGKPVVVGPHTRNFARLAALFTREQALIQVRDAAELQVTVSALLADADARARWGAAARRVFEANLGAGKKSAEMILQYLDTARTSS